MSTSMVSLSHGDKLNRRLTNASGSTLIDKFEQFELTTDLKQMSPREARLGRWVLLYGVLQVLSTLSVDVQGLKHTDGVRTFLCTDLKRMPEWVSNGQLEHLEATQQRSWCWQRAWDPTPTQTAPVELEATSSLESNNNVHGHGEIRSAEIAGHPFPSPPPERALPAPPSSLDGATLMQNDIRRLGEKIDNLSLSHNATDHFTQEFVRRRENEKVIQDEFIDRKPRLQGETFGPRAAAHHNTSFNPRMDSLRRDHRNELPRSQSRMDDSFRLTESDFIDRQQQALLPPPLNPAMRSHVTSVNTDLGAYPFSSNEMQWPVPPNYSEREDTSSYRESTVLGNGYGSMDFDGMNVGVRRSPRGQYERGGWS
jgi:hypothetical protein